MSTMLASIRTAQPLYTAERYRPDQSVGYLMKRVLLSIVQHAEARFGPLDVTHAQWLPLYQLAEAGRPMPVAELARMLETDAGGMTRLLDRLEKKHLCRRVRSLEDRRVVMVELTPDGTAAAKRVPLVMSEVLNAHLAGFSPAEWQALLGYLQRMRENADALSFGRMVDRSDTDQSSNNEGT